ncbi:BCCT family transporter [Psychrilyobacter atlanticus]|uniref:BCCT family transporter n=1 Tax=Psychrilyobacter atlanticus TaxID=271091 RepID=UPI0004088059|nr:BCCT family transporter [Psychrilyobacter atlanticus]
MKADTGVIKETNIKKSDATFYISIGLTLAIVLWGLVLPASFEKAGNATFGYLVNNFGWLYTISMSSFVAFCAYLAFSKYGSIKLGPDNSKPEYTLISWFAMLFSAGMGIGLVFWGAAEPMNFYVNPIIGIEGGTPRAAAFAMQHSFMHWGLHPWANYSVLALAMAYMQFRKGKPALVSSVFIPIVGEKATKSWFGKMIDVFAIFATVAGVATSLGLGTYQINSGLNYLFGVPENSMVQIIIVGVITAIFMLSAMAGVDKGMKFISNLNVGVILLMLVVCFLVGPTLLILKVFVESLGNYMGGFVTASFEMGTFTNDSWYGSWTVFYWAWWIAWAPFVGSFIARISKGRTIREFITGVLLAPTLASFIWFSVFGSMGLAQGLDLAKEAIASTPTALFVVLSKYPMGMVVSIIAVILLCTFFITSADAATFVLGMLSSKGDLNPPVGKKLLWGGIQSGLALALMLASANGLKMLQTISLVAAFPFVFIMIFAMISLMRSLKAEKNWNKEEVAETEEVETEQIIEA